MNDKEINTIMGNIQNNLLTFIEKEDDTEENFQDLNKLFDENQITENHYLFNSLLHLITNIGNNSYRCSNFFDKLFKIILLLKTPIKQSFSNSQIFNIFQSNKRLLLFLIEEEMLTIDGYILKRILKDESMKLRYSQYFIPEIGHLIKTRNKNKKEINDEFYIKRRIGENDDYICQLIRKDSIKEFLIYINKNNYSINNKINTSCFETNQLLIEKQVNLIEYAAFFGSIQIFKYLHLNGIDITPSLMSFAIHGKNIEIIHLIEERFTKDISYYDCFKESIKCHHNDFANYFMNNYLDYGKIEKSFDIFINCLKYHNFVFLNTFFISQSSLYYLCIYDYPYFISSLLKGNFIDMNHVRILNIF